MAKRFRGDADNKIDTKGRVSIPAAFRRVLEEGDPDWEKGLRPNLIVVYGRMDDRRCLECYTMNGIEEVEDVVEDLPHFSEERYRWERILLSQSMHAQLDDNGRLGLNQKLRELIGAKVEEDVKLVGMGNRFQIWHPKAYEDDTAQAMAQHKAMMSKALGEGRPSSRSRKQDGGQ